LLCRGPYDFQRTGAFAEVNRIERSLSLATTFVV
jgi:hypothetical protein